MLLIKGTDTKKKNKKERKKEANTVYYLKAQDFGVSQSWIRASALSLTLEKALSLPRLSLPIK